jgi:2'-5' RNA ligase
MTGMFITLVFDEKADAQIHRLLAKLQATGVSTAYAPDSPGRHRPHMTLSGYDVAQPEDWDEPLERLASRRKPFPLLLHALGLFVEAGTVYLAPRINRELIATREAVLTYFEQHSIPPRSPNFAHDRFNPHCTLVPQSSGEETLRAIETCRQNWEPIDAMAVGIGMVVPPDVVDRRQYRFEGRE